MTREPWHRTCTCGRLTLPDGKAGKYDPQTGDWHFRAGRCQPTRQAPVKET